VSANTQFIADHEERMRQLALGLAVRSSTTGDELLVDNFAGGGGASKGIELAFGRKVDIAINHDGEALAMHTANHPETAHYQEDVFDVHPGFITGQRRIGLAWFSPDCKHHSKAKGGKPRDQKIRGLAWVALKWAAFQKPRCIAIENVEEIQSWGPLDENGKPIKAERGRTFRAFIDALSTGLDQSHPDVAEIYEALGADFPMAKLYGGLGYKVEYRLLRACDFGTPTTRKRLFIFARCDGLPIRWPTPTHGNPKAKGFKASGLQVWKTAADCIDWSIHTTSIFDRKKPLADATCKRIAKGIMRYVVNAQEPFIVPRSDDMLNVSTMIQTGYGERAGQAPRVPGLEKPIGTLVGSQKHALVTALLAKHYTGAVGSAISEPIGAITSVDHHSYVTATMVAIDNQSSSGGYGSITDPVKTIVTENRHALVTAHITKFNTGSVGLPIDTPLHTIIAGGQQARPGTAITQGIVTANLVHMGHGETSASGSKRWSHGVRDVQEPLNTVTASGVPAGLVTTQLMPAEGAEQPEEMPINRSNEVRAFLIKYYSEGGQWQELQDPMHTIPTKDRIGLVTVRSQDYVIVDIGLRMLTPRELARAQGFPDDYILAPLVPKCRRMLRSKSKQGVKSADRTWIKAPLSKSAQVRMIGNSVCPPLARALIEANFTHEQKLKEAA
jgi:DNA (cytosine-5)-methyltransferase 1